jgi:trk system potassium uptake protein TrkA
VIEQDPDRCERLSGSRRAVLIRGDATGPEVIDRADPERADVLAALTGAPETNHARRRGDEPASPD